jgi:FAD/FMN-containing dehydrogenase
LKTFSNWNHEIRFAVPDENFKEPKDIAEVQAIVTAAFERSERVTVVGALHSTTECMVGIGVIVSMTNMAKVLRVDPDNLLVTVQAGVSLHQLCGVLKEHGLQPGVILEFGNFQIGALSGTLANDTSITRAGQFSSFVYGVKLVTPTGEIREISEAQDPDLLPFVRSHFGLFGVVCEITLHVFKTKPLRITTKKVEVESFLDSFQDNLRDLKATQDQVFGMLFPHTRKLLWQCRKYVEPEAMGVVDGVVNLVRSKGINLYKDVLLPVVKAGSSLSSSALAELLGRAVVEVPLGVFSHDSYVIDPCDRGIIYNPDDPHFDFYDWVFPEDRWADMVRAFLQLADRFRQERNFVLALPTLIYFIKRDQASLLSRSRRFDMMAVDPTYPDPEDSHWKEFRLAFNEIAMSHGGIPHINKTRDGAIGHFARSHDPDALEAYLGKRKEFDPKDLFLNDFFKTLFGEYL